MEKIKFLNIDLDIESSVDISPIVAQWGERVCVFRHEEVDGQFYGAFETCCDGVDAILEEYLDLIESLTVENRKIWDSASKKVFDFGFESGLRPVSFHALIDARHIQRLAAVGASVVITIYPVDQSDA